MNTNDYKCVYFGDNKSKNFILGLIFEGLINSICATHYIKNGTINSEGQMKVQFKNITIINTNLLTLK